MALKFLNKKGWHTGSLRNIENVWKAEQKHEAEQRKLEELRKQIHEEHERAEFRRMQEQAGFAPRQERLDFLYESGLAVGKGSSEGFKALQAPVAASSAAAVSGGESSSSKAAVPGALFEDKPQSANDAWRKLHSDPLLLIRQREQEALARIKNNPIKMAMIKKSVEAEKKQKQDKEKRKKRKHKEHDHSKSKNEKHKIEAQSDTEDSSDGDEERRGHSKSERQEDNETRFDDYKKIRRREHQTSERQETGKSKHEKHSSVIHSDYGGTSEGEEGKRKGYHSRHDKHFRQAHPGREEEERRNRDDSKWEPCHNRHSNHDRNMSRVDSGSRYTREENERKLDRSASEHHRHNSELGKAEKQRVDSRQNLQHTYNHRRGVPKMSEEERAARLREMQMDAELHEEQRWKRLKKAAEADAQEAMTASSSKGRTFLDAAQRSIYGAEEGGSVTIEESVRRRTYYSQGNSSHESNAFRR